MNIELLADSDIPSQGIVFMIVIIFSFLKWLYTSLTNKAPNQDNGSQGLADLYEQYRENIQNRQANSLEYAHSEPPVTDQSVPAPTPPELPEMPSASQKFDSATSLVYSQDDIKQASVQKRGNSIASPILSSAELKRESRSPQKSITSQLRNKQSLRNALVLQEILSPPKALKDSSNSL